MAEAVRAFDWTATPLGASSQWAPDLKLATGSVLDNALPAMLAWGPDRTAIVNDGFRALFGTGVTGLGRTLAEVWQKAWPAIESAADRVLTGRPTIVEDVALEAVRSALVPQPRYTVALSPSRALDGTVPGFIATLVRQAGPLPSEAETGFRELMAGFAQAAWETDAEGVPIWSPTWHAFTGLAKTATTVTDWLERVHPEDRDEAGRRWHHALATGESVDTEFRLRRADGGWSWTNVRAVPIRAADGTIRKWFGVNLDVTRRKATEEALREREAELARVQRIGGIGGIKVDVRDGLMGERSPEYRRLHGMPDEKTRESHAEWLNRLHPEDRVAAEKRFLDAIAGDARSYENEYRIIRPSDGSIRWIYARADIERDADGEALRVVGAHIDITDRKRIESELRDSEERLLRTFEALPVGVGVTDQSGHMSRLNPMMRRYLPNAIIPSRSPERQWRWRPPVQNGVPLKPADFPAARALLGEEVVPGLEMLYRDDDGSEVWTRISAVPLRDAAGAVTGAVMVVEDIDDAKRAEETLRESEELLRRFGEATQDVLWIRDAETLQWQYLTPAFEEIYGLGVDEALEGDNFRNWTDLIVPEDRPMALGFIARAKNGEQVAFEYRIRRPFDGGIRWLRNTDFPMFGRDGKVESIGGIAQDFTDKKVFEERLRGEEERLRLALESGRLATWDWDIASGRVEWSDEHYRQQGYSVGEVTPSYDAWRARVHPDDVEAAEAALTAARERREVYACEFRTLHPDGTLRWLDAQGRFFYDIDGAPVRMIGVMQDVTERRHWQERLQILVGELQHRTRNLLRIVRSVADRTIAGSADLDTFRESFLDRLDALARIQGLLSRLGDHDRVTFDDLLSAELSAMDDGSGRVQLLGPKGIRLRSSTVQILAMALHELATNAMKYGALRHAGAQLSIRWWMGETDARGRRLLNIEWRESGVPMATQDLGALGRGQGRELIERALPYQLDAETLYELHSDGIRCAIALPVSASNLTREEDHA